MIESNITSENTKNPKESIEYTSIEINVSEDVREEVEHEERKLSCCCKTILIILGIILANGLFYSPVIITCSLGLCHEVKLPKSNDDNYNHNPCSRRLDNIGSDVKYMRRGAGGTKITHSPTMSPTCPRKIAKIKISEKPSSYPSSSPSLSST